MVYIYGLFNDLSNELVYVGRTRDLGTRFKAHKHTTAKDFKDSCRLEVLQSGEQLESSDEYFWIEYMRYIGVSLVNKHISLAKSTAPIQPVNGYVAKNLRDMRIQRFLTQKDVSKKAGVSLATIVSAETGRMVGPNTVKKLATFFDVSPSQIVGDQSEKS